MPRLSIPQILATQEVRRWHTRRVRREQTVAEHSAVVALLAHFLAPEDLSAEETVDLFHLALIHDAHEARFGDTPFPAKIEMARDGFDLDAHCRWSFWGGTDPYLLASDRVVDLVEVADILEAALFAQRNALEIADLVVEQAICSARARLCNAGVARVLEALGRRVEVEP